MSFEEIKNMTFKQSLMLIDEFSKVKEERSKAVNSMLKRTKEVMPTFDVTSGIYD